MWTQPFRQCWAYQIENLSQTKIASDNELIFIPLLSGRIQSVNSTSGKLLWDIEIGGEIISELITDKSNIFILNEENSNPVGQNERSPTSNDAPKIKISLRSVDSTSGVTNWKKTFTVSKGKVRLFLYENQLVLVTENGSINLIDSQSGNVLREYETNKHISSANVLKETMILGTEDRKLIVFPISGEGKTEEFSVQDIPSDIFSNSSEKILWAGYKGTLNVTSIHSGNLFWTKRFGAGVSGVEGVSKGLLVTSLDNFVYLIEENRGGIIWKRRLAARISEKPFIRDNVSVVLAFGENSAVIIELNKGKVINSISLSDANLFAGNPVYVEKQLIFPTLRGLYSFSNDCPKR